MIYKLLCIESGNVVERSEIEADSDSEALELVALRRETTDCELWCGKRRIAAIARGANPRVAGFADNDPPRSPRTDGYCPAQD